MSAPSTAQDFLDLLSKSRLLGDLTPDDCLAGLADPGAPGGAARLAEQLVAGGRLTRFQADHLLRGKWLRFFIGPYKVLRPLGTGTAGAVYLCEHTRMRRQVAVKVLLAAAARKHSGLERFYREARAAAALDHPNIVHAFDVGRDDRLHYLAMEYVNGVNLAELVRAAGPLREARAAGYLRQAALGLGHAHEAGLVHRDLKPSNLMVDRSGVVKVLDLGLARFFEDDEGNLTRGDVLGVEDYIAPEQVLDSHSVDGRADVYSLGASFYFAVTGHPPPRAGVPAPRPGGPRRAPADLFDVLHRMMAQEPEDRYQTPGEVVEAVARWASPPPATVRPGVSKAGPTPVAGTPAPPPGGTAARPNGKKTRGKPRKQTRAPARPGRCVATPTASAARPTEPAAAYDRNRLWTVVGVVGGLLACGLLAAAW